MVLREIDYGEKLRLGVIVPSGNVIAEPQINAMLPAGVVAYFTRLELRGSSEPELLEMSRHVESGARLLADAQVKAIVFHCTAVTTFSPQMGQEIQSRIEAATGLPAFSTSEAIVSALQALQAKKIVLITPYIEEVNARECAFLAHHGVEVVGQVGLGISTNAEMGKLGAQTWVDLARQLHDPKADAYFISCTAIRSAEAIGRIEALLGRPVITSNQAMVWFGLRKFGVSDQVPGYGRLFEPQYQPA